MNNDLKLSKLLGGMSLCLGAAEIMAGGRIARALRLGVPGWVVRLFGVREVASGFAVLAHPDEAVPVGLRLAGDALDLAVLGRALLPGGRSPRAAQVAAVAVVAVTALDLAAGVSLRRRQARVLETARRTRIR